MGNSERSRCQSRLITTENMREQLISFFENNLGLAPGEITDNTPLYSTGLLDSFGMVEALMFIGEISGVRFGPDDMSLDNLDSIERMVAFVEASRGAQ